jgi:hypothetical protein
MPVPIPIIIMKGFPVVTMNLRHFYLFAVAAAALGYSANFLDAQSTRVQPDTSVTNLSNLNRPRNAPASLGMVDAGTKDSIDLAVASGLDLGNLETTEVNNIPTSRRAKAYTQPSSFGGQPAAPNSFVPTFKYSSLHIPDRRQMSKAVRGLQFGQIGSASMSREREGAHDSQHHRAASQMERFTGGPGETSSIQADEQDPFERLDDPFSGISKPSFEEFNSGLNVEHACGAACGLRPTKGIKSFDSETRKSRYTHTEKDVVGPKGPKHISGL